MASSMPSRNDLLALFDAEARRIDATAAEGHPFTLDGPIMRIEFPSADLVHAPADLRVDGPELEALIERQVRAASSRGVRLEWKTYADDRPDLVALLLAAGFEPEPVEAVMVASSEMPQTAPPPGVSIRDADDELETVVSVLEHVWSVDHGFLISELTALRRELGIDGLRILIAEAEGEAVAAAWVVMRPGARFAGLWGGSTHPAFRGRGIYRALVSHRAAIAAVRGIPLLRVDASAASRPILHANGFMELTTTTPYLWAPA